MTFTQEPEPPESFEPTAEPNQDPPGRGDRYGLAGKIVLVATLSVILGSFMSSQSAASAAEADALTFEDYVSQYEDHKAELAGYEMSFALATISSIIMLALMALIYEGGSWSVTWVLRRLLTGRQPSAGGLARG